MKYLNKLFGDPNAKYLKKLQPIVNKINSWEKDFSSLSDEGLKNKTQEFKDRLKNGSTLDDILPEAFATVREVSRRTTGMRHYDVQLLGGIILHNGQITEMKTGEGKTLVATLPVYLNSLAGKGVHLITVNDYLARRDAVWMSQIYHFLGMSVACIQQQNITYLYDPAHETHDETVVEVDMENLRPCTRKEGYAADITYGTNNEFGFDYLRDNMALDSEYKSQRKLNYAIVDEIDSILIDEARTPLIISAPTEESAEMYMQFAQIARQLVENEDYNVDEKMHAATLSETGVMKVEKILNVGNIYTDQKMDLVYHIENAIKAKALFKKDKDYVVKESEVVIVDEFTGRLMEGRRYSEGLHQAIEAKEGVKVQQESKTLASITFQNLFRMYDKLSGMTGTAFTEAEEFYKIYGLEVSVVPTNKPIARKDKEDSIYSSEKGKYEALIREVKKSVDAGQPVLIGTVSIEKNELIHELLERSGVKNEILNAKHHAREAEIIAQAGKPGSVTVATNMAGRGVDIILGGSPFNKEAHEQVKQAGGLYVIGTERHESRRIDNQLRGRAGRQGDAGTTQFFISMEDDLMRIFGSDRMKAIMKTLKVPEDMPIENKLISKSIETAQKKIEGHNFDIRKHLVEYDDVINKHREVVYKKRDEVMAAAEKDIDENNNADKSAIKLLINELIENEIEQVVSFHTSAELQKDWDAKEIFETVKTIYPVDNDLLSNLEKWCKPQSEKKSQADSRTVIIDKLVSDAKTAYENLEQKILSGPLGENKSVMRQVEKGVYLRALDTLWISHIDTLDRIRQGIGLRGYGQRDPLVEYKKEAFRLFSNFTSEVQNQVVYSIYKIAAAQDIATRKPLQRKGLTLSAPAKTMEKAGQTPVNSNAKNNLPNASSSASVESIDDQYAHHEDGSKVGRNEPCPCGKTKSDGTPIKYKHCHGK